MSLQASGAALFTGLALIACTACSAAPDAAGTPFDAAHRASIVDSVSNFFDDYAALVAAADYDALIELYADHPDFVWVEEGRVAYRSKAAIVEAFDGLRSMNAEVRSDFTDRVITALAPGVANFTSGLDQEFVFGPGAATSFTGAVTGTVINTPDGWRFLNGHTSSQRPDDGG